MGFTFLFASEADLESRAVFLKLLQGSGKNKLPKRTLKVCT